MGYQCDTHADRPAVLLITNLGNGDTTGICPECIHPWAAALADAFAPAPAADAQATATTPGPDDPSDDPGDDPAPLSPTPDALPEAEPDVPNHPDPNEHPEADDDEQGFSPETIAAALGDQVPVSATA